MKQKLLNNFRLRALMLVALMCAAFTGARAADETIKFSEQGYDNSVAVETVSGTDFTITFNKGTNNNAPKYYTTGSAIRVYGGGYMTVASETKTIEKIELTFGSGDGSNAITTDAGTYDSGTWTGSASSVTFTVGGTSGHRRIASVAVTFASSDPEDTRVATTTSINVPEAFVTDLAGSTNVSAGTLTASVTGVDGAPVDASVEWTSSDEAVATVADGVVTLLAVGTTTITATFEGDNNYQGSRSTYTLNVIDSNAKGGINNPYTVAEARAAIDAGTGTTNVYATGIVSAIPTAYNSSFSNITFNFVDNSGDEVFLQAYRCTGDEAADVEVGDIVVVSGNLTKYSTTYEFGQGCKLVSLTHPTVAVEKPTFSPEGGTYTEAQSVTIACATEDASIKYSFDNQTWLDYAAAIELSDYATTTIYAKAVKDNDESAVAEATYTIQDPNGPGTENNPYSVADAIAFIQTLGSATSDVEVYVSGIVSQVDSYNSDYSSITYWISDDGATDNQMQVYSGKGLDGADFNAKEDLQAGDEVTVKGYVKLYNNNTPEFDKNNVLVAFNRTEKEDAGIAFTGTTSEYTVTFGETFEAPELDNPNGLTVTYSSSDENVATVDETGAVTILAAGTTTITASSEATDTYKAGSASYTLTVVAPVQNYAITWTTDNNVSLTVSTDPTAALESGAEVAEGATVTISATFTEGYELRTLAAYQDNDVIELVAGETSNVWTFTMPAGAVSIRAISQESSETPEPTGDQFVKVTSTSDLTDGDYLIVYEDGPVAFNGGLETLDATSNTIEVTIADDAITKTDATAAAIFTIASIDGGYSILAASGKYIGQTSDANGLKAQDEAIANTISFGDNGEANIVAGGAYLRYNASSGQERFRYYKSGSYTNQKAVYLYKLGGEPDTRVAIAEITVLSPTQVNIGDIEDFTLRATFAEGTVAGEDYELSWTSSDPTILELAGSTYEAKAEGTVKVTVHVTVLDDTQYKEVEETFEVTVVDGREELTLSFTGVPSTIDIDGTATYTATPDIAGVAIDITYSSSDEEVVYVDGESGEILAGAVGTATITATFAGNETYKPATASYTITVVDPNVQTTYYALVADLGNGAGKALSTTPNGTSAMAGVDVDIVNGKVINGQADNISWEITESNDSKIVKSKDGKYLVHGTANKNIDLKLSDFSTGSEWVKTDRGDFGATLGRAQAIQWSTSANVFKNYAETENGYYAASQYTFADGYTRELTAGNFGTFCADHTIATDDYAGVTFYSILGKTVDESGAPKAVVIEPVTGELTAGVAYIFQANDTKLIAAYSDESIDAPFSAEDNNGLQGSFEGQDVDGGMYLITNVDGKAVVQLCGTGCSIAENRAFINMRYVPEYNEQEAPAAGVKFLGLADNATGIRSLAGAQDGAVIYNVAGQRVNKTTKGLYIVNGKKTLVK